jgi:hypothetical protein
MAPDRDGTRAYAHTEHARTRPHPDVTRTPRTRTRVGIDTRTHPTNPRGTLPAIPHVMSP